MLNVCVYWQKTVNEDAFNDKVVAGITQSAEETIPKRTGSRREKNVPWWDGNCRKAVKSRNKAFRQLKKHHSIETSESQAVVRRCERPM